MKNIKILGTGCAKCVQLGENAKQAAESLDIDFEIEKVTKLNDIMGFGVMITPALVVDGEVKSSGKLLSVDQIKEILG